MLAWSSNLRQHTEVRILLTLVISLVICLPSHTAVASAPTALSILNKLEVKGRAAKTGYTRSQFSHWSDPDRNGCDSRNDILKRDLKMISFKDGTRNCKVISGELVDPFSGKKIRFDLNTSVSNVDIDHIVALSNAWQTGAAYFDKNTRSNIANDPLNLLAVDASLNRQKGDGDAATWLPPLKSFRCEYVARQVAVKFKYKLWVTVPEKNAITNILAKCPKQVIP